MQRTMSGDRAYTYRTKRFLWRNLVWLTPGVAFLIGRTMQETYYEHPLIVWLPLSVPMWLWCAYFTRNLFAWSKEKVILTDRELVWIDPAGHERLRVPHAAIRNVTFKINQGDDESISVAKVATALGTVKFSSWIDAYEELSLAVNDLAAKARPLP